MFLSVFAIVKLESVYESVDFKCWGEYQSGSYMQDKFLFFQHTHKELRQVFFDLSVEICPI